MEKTRASGKEPRRTGSDLEAVRRELHVVQERFRSIIERTADGILVVDGEGVIRFANPTAAELFGRSSPELVGSPFGTPLSDEAMEIDIRRDGDPAVAELRVVDTVWEGEPASIVALRDITDRRKAEERERQLFREQLARSRAEQAARRASLLSEASRRLASSLDFRVTVGVVGELLVEEFADFCIIDLVIGDSGIRRMATRGEGRRAELLREATAYPLEPAAGSPQARAFRDCEPLHVREVDEEWLREATRDDAHLAIARELGMGSLVLAPIYAGHECLGVLTAGRWRESDPFDLQEFHFATDLAERAALAIENALLYEEAQAANRTKANFLSVMSHELRTPLSAIIGYADLIDRGVAGEITTKQAKFIGRIRASSNHLLQIIEEILAFASAEAGEERVHAEPSSLDEILDGILAVAEPLAQDAPIDFIVEVEEPEARLETDTRKVRQILLNLISNAFKFTTEGHVRLRAGVEGEEVVFVVEDTGCGIDEASLEHIFDRFWQAEDPRTRRAGGTGLGLAVARGFVELLGGTIGVRSTVGEGSTFTVRLPRRAPRVDAFPRPGHHIS